LNKLHFYFARFTSNISLPLSLNLINIWSSYL